MGVVVRHLSKSYGKHIAVQDVSFEVPSGSLFAFLGTNGAGKSTTIGCLTTVLKADAGEVEIDDLRLGRDDTEIRRRIGVVFQDSLLDPLLTARENLDTRAVMYHLSAAERRARIDDLADLLDVREFLDRRYGGLSGGQKRRVDIARALIHRPSVVFLDEPTAGLDPQSRDHVWSAIRQLRQLQGTTVFLTTHYMEETEAADAVCIIDRARIVAQGTPAELRRQHSSSVLSMRFTSDHTAEEFLSGRKVEFGKDRDLFAVNVQSSDEARILLQEAGESVIDFEFRHGTMDDVFLTLTRGVSE